MNDKVALIDGDILIHRFAWSEQSDFDWDNDGVTTVVANCERAAKQIGEFIEFVLDETGCARAVFIMSDKVNFRKTVMPTYKSNRKDADKATLIDDLRVHFKSDQRRFKTVSITGLEADDVIGIMMTEAPDMFVACSIDKDLDQIPGRHYNWNSGADYVVPLSVADLWFYQQILSGDPVDGYSGVPRVGPKTAHKIVQTVRDGYGLTTPLAHLSDDFHAHMWDTIVDTYESKGLTADDALVTARVARILRSDDWNKFLLKPILWSPQWTS